MFKIIRNVKEIDELNKRNVELARQVRDLNKENLAVHNENKDLRFDKESIVDCLNEIEKELNKQQYNNIENLKNKIKSILKTAKSF